MLLDAVMTSMLLKEKIPLYPLSATRRGLHLAGFG
jgi:hypothetical protein